MVILPNCHCKRQSKRYFRHKGRADAEPLYYMIIMQWRRVVQKLKYRTGLTLLTAHSNVPLVSHLKVPGELRLLVFSFHDMTFSKEVEVEHHTLFLPIGVALSNLHRAKTSNRIYMNNSSKWIQYYNEGTGIYAGQKIVTFI